MRGDCGDDIGEFNQNTGGLRRRSDARIGARDEHKTANLMKRLGAAALLLAAVAAPVHAQQRTITDGTPGQILRAWPQAGVWLVILGVSKDHVLACGMLTGQGATNSGEAYVWGFRRNGGSFSLVVGDKNQAAVAGAALKVVIDGSPLGTYQISQRVDEDGFHHVNAELPAPAAGALSRLLRIGGSVQFLTGSATYAAPLNDAAQAMGNLDACAHEADELNAARQSKN